MGERRLFRELFAADSLSLQFGSFTKTHWAAKRGLLAGQVSVIFTETPFPTFFYTLLYIRMSIYFVLFINCCNTILCVHFILRQI